MSSALRVVEFSRSHRLMLSGAALMSETSVEEGGVLQDWSSNLPGARRLRRSRVAWACLATVITCLVLVFAAHGTALASANIYSSERISSDIGPEVSRQEFSQPIVAGDRVSWVRQMSYYAGGSVSNLYTWTPATGEVQLATGVSATWLRGSGDRLAWMEAVEGGGYEVGTWTPDSGTVRFGPGNWPYVSDDRVAWVVQGNRIKTWTPEGGVVDVDPAATSGMAQIYTLYVSTDRIVWCTIRISEGTDYEVYTWTPAGGVQQLTNDTVDQSGVAVSGDRIAWGGSDGFYLWTPATGAVHVTSTGWDTPLAMSGDRIVGSSSVTTSGVTYDNLWTWTPAGGKVQLDSVTGYYVDVDLDGDRVAWVDSSYNSQLWTWTPASGKIAVTPVGSYFAQFYGCAGISGDRLAWNLAVGDDRGSMCTGFPLTVEAPTITSVSPAEGPTSGGNSVVIKGTDFYWVAGAPAVTFGGTNANSYKVDSLTQITAVAPAHGAGPMQVQVTAAGGTTADTAADDYHYDGPPTISSITPAVASSAGGTPVVITGTGFENLLAAEGVKFGNTNAAGYTVNSLTQITVITPAHVPGMVRVTVTTSGGESADTSADDFTFTPAFGPSEQFPPVRVTSNSYDDEMPEVSGDRIVWAAIADGTDYEVFTWTPSTAVVRLTTNSRDDQYPMVSGDRIAWVQTGGSDGGTDDEVFTWTPAGGVVQLTQNNLEDGWVNISGDRIVWMEAQTTAGENADIFSWTPSGTQRITNNSYEDYYPEVSGDRIAWVNDSSPNGKALTWTPSEGTVEVYSGDRSIDYAAVSGDRVACASMPNYLYVWTPTGGSWVYAGNIGFDLRIDGDRIAWDADVRGVNQIFSWTPAEGTTQLSKGVADQFLERVSGDRVVWLDYGTTDAEVYCWTADRGTVQVTSNTVEEWSPVVSGDRLVWMADNTLGTTEIYTAVAMPPLTRYEQTDPHIAYSAGWSLYPAPPTIGPSSGGNYSRANTLNCSATIYFFGKKLDWIAMKGTTTGKARVQLDGEPAETVDLANPAGAIYEVKVWSTPPLDAGLHKVTISWDPSNAAGKYITLDAVDVVGTLVSAPPTITGLSPGSGSTAGGNSVTITGNGFTEVSRVAFGSLDATSYTVDSPTKINAVAPAHSAETVRVQVTTAGGTTSDTAFDNYTYAEIAVPTVTGLDPASGLAGAAVAVTGTGFVGVSTVTFGGANATSITVTDAGHLTAVAPAHAAGTADVVVTALGGSSSAGGAGNDFTYLTPPVLNKYEQSVSGLYWTGTWTVGSSTSYSGGSYRYTNTSGSSLTLAFYGTQFSLISKKTYSLGNLSISIDGGTAATADLYSKTTLYKQTVYTSPTLADGLHTVEISRAGTKNPSSSGYSVNVDAVAIAGTLASYLKAEQTDTRISYKGTWATASTTSASGSSYRLTNSLAASFSIPFSGTIELYATLRFSMGKADIYLDGVKETSIDLGSASTLYKQKVATIVAPDRGVHVLSVVRAVENASNLYINLDYVTVAGSLPTATTFEQTNTKILFTGVWTLASSTSYSGGNHKYADATGALATVDFTGAQISLVCRKSANYGIAWVRIDDGDPIPIDLYSASTLYKQTVWTSPFLTPGDHTLTVECAGTKRAAATGVRIDLDAVKIIGTVR